RETIIDLTRNTIVRIGLLVFATNKYVRFVPELHASVKKYFMNGKNHEARLFLFTDRPELHSDVVAIPQKHLPWPEPTLKRYHIFLNHAALLSEMDYLFYTDADMRFVDNLGD